ncbi:hypothetical protein GCM10009775_32850 [Microbacterium aoyamense]|uniref:MftR C-terminal domain-containing protein n=1 Tax=Microbacterium aoyamense TaxID=344166 RepID=A0ABN2Q142_9MICO|nr:hypothetical protein [Microbacterium aoyamense]
MSSVLDSATAGLVASVVDRLAALGDVKWSPEREQILSLMLGELRRDEATLAVMTLVLAHVAIVRNADPHVSQDDALNLLRNVVGQLLTP